MEERVDLSLEGRGANDSLRQKLVRQQSLSLVCLRHILPIREHHVLSHGEGSGMQCPC